MVKTRNYGPFWQRLSESRVKEKLFYSQTQYTYKVDPELLSGSVPEAGLVDHGKIIIHPIQIQHSQEIPSKALPTDWF